MAYLVFSKEASPLPGAVKRDHLAQGEALSHDIFETTPLGDPLHKDTRP
jgi:hypothetical protein